MEVGRTFDTATVGKGRKRKLVEQSNVPGGSKRKKPNSLDEKSNRVVTDINVESFAESRAVEIQALTEVIKNVGGNHMAFQKLPRHMRRRAMSHNIKRVPRRLHHLVKSELEKTKPPAKRPSRRHRRRPKNLLAEYERRKRKVGWLETHIWHAKRFKMVERWNYRLALHPNEKSIRACYRAVSKHCLIQDVSYESYIEVRGLREKILDGLSHLTSDKTGPTFAAKMTLLGTRQGKLTLYAHDSYPFSPIGEVTYLWRAGNSKQDGGHNSSVLWICCHPSYYTQALTEINNCFNKTLQTNTDNTLSSCPEIESQDEVTVTSLKDQLVKFRLYGPASNRILSEVLQIPDIGITDTLNDEDVRSCEIQDSESINEARDKSQHKNEESSMKHCDVNSLSKSTSSWQKNFYSSNTKMQCFQEQVDLWSRVRLCSSPAEAPPNCVLALTVKDPRLLLPPKKNKVSTINSGSTMSCLSMELFTARVAFSPLWDAEVREEVKASKISEQELNRMKSQKLVPGCPLQLGDQESWIPVILIQRPGTCSNMSSSRLGYASGWDVVIPSGWAMAFWVALVYRGVRVGGIRETRSITLQAGLMCSPFDDPDSPAGTSQIKTDSETFKSRHDRRPPAKRPNYTKLGFLSPFIFEYDKLVHEWSQRTQSVLQKLEKHFLDNNNLALSDIKTDFYVLRDRKCLKLLNTVLTNTRGFLNPKNNKAAHSSLISENLTSIREVVQQHCSALVPVLLNILHRGVPATFGHICLPSAEDLLNYDKDKGFGGPVEGKHIDPEKRFRKEERKKRLKLRMKKKRGKGKVNDGAPSVSSKTNEFVGPTVTTKTNVTDSKLLDHNSRVVCGFINSGDFDLGKGHGIAIGFCSMASLLHLLEQQQNRKCCTVLVRNPTSLQYRFASLSVVS